MPASTPRVSVSPPCWSTSIALAERGVASMKTMARAPGGPYQTRCIVDDTCGFGYEAALTLLRNKKVKPNPPPGLWAAPGIALPAALRWRVARLCSCGPHAYVAALQSRRGSPVFAQPIFVHSRLAPLDEDERRDRKSVV